MISSVGRLDLNLAADRKVLRTLLGNDPATASLGDYVDDYLRFFQGPEWRDVYSGGLVGNRKGGSAHELDRLLRIAATMRSLEACEGFSQVTRGLVSPPQFLSTLFEIETAGWCTTRKLHKDIRFSPPVHRGSSAKYPDFFWSTQRGDLWCECKQARLFLSKATRRLEKIGDLVNGIVKSSGLPEDVRVEVRLPSSLLNEAGSWIQQATRQAIQEHLSGGNEITDVRGIRAVVVPRTAEFTRGPDSMVQMVATIGPKPINLTPEYAYMAVVMDASRARARLARALLHEARQQLPLDAPGAVFLDGVGANAAKDVLVAEVDSPSTIVWGLLCDKQSQVVWRNEQPFNKDLCL